MNHKRHRDAAKINEKWSRSCRNGRSVASDANPAAQAFPQRGLISCPMHADDAPVFVEPDLCGSIVSRPHHTGASDARSGEEEPGSAVGRSVARDCAKYLFHLGLAHADLHAMKVSSRYARSGRKHGET